MLGKKKCILTLDYELFFKKSGTVESCIIDPTYRILDILSSIGGKAVFFVDTIYLNILRKSQDIDDYKNYLLIEKQLKQIVAQGSRIELHLHPHWLDAIKKDNEWFFPHYTHYKLSSLSEDEIENLFYEGVSLLNEIGDKVKQGYSVMAFRAGGWCIEPFSKLKDVFFKNHIFIDSSVVSGLRFDSPIYQVDYSNIPFLSHYSFSDDPKIPEKNGDFLEFPVNGYYLSLIQKLRFFIGSKYHYLDSKIFGDGEGLRAIEPKSIPKKVMNLIKGKIYSQYSLDGYICASILQKKIVCSQLSFITVVVHPKTLTNSSLRAIYYLADKGHQFVSFEEFTVIA